MKHVLRPLAERWWLDTWEKIVAFTGDEWFPSLLPFGKFKGRLYQEARENVNPLGLLPFTVNLLPMSSGRTKKVGRAGNIALAAKGDPTRQSLISRQITELEPALGLALLDRTKKPFQPTLAAQQLADKVQHRAISCPSLAVFIFLQNSSIRRRSRSDIRAPSPATRCTQNS